MNNRVRIEKEGHVAIVTLDRPEKMNALDMDMFDAIIQAGEDMEKDASVRCVVLRGEGRGFCAGMDLANFSPDNKAMLNEPLIERTYGVANKWQKVAWTWRELSVPVIAAVHGVAYGGGLQIMLGADIKYITADTRLAIMEMKWGLIPDMAGTQLMLHAVRDDIVRELTYTNRVFSGTQAVEYGFATHLSENPYEDALKLAKEIASKSPSAIVTAKRVLNKAPYVTAEEGLMLESVEQDKILRKPNQMEAVFSSLQKRPGNFEDYR